VQCFLRNGRARCGRFLVGASELKATDTAKGSYVTKYRPFRLQRALLEANKVRLTCDDRLVTLWHQVVLQHTRACHGCAWYEARPGSGGIAGVLDLMASRFSHDVE
jgi:hypothetical protein